MFNIMMLIKKILLILIVNWQILCIPHYLDKNIMITVKIRFFYIEQYSVNSILLIISVLEIFQNYFNKKHLYE